MAVSRHEEDDKGQGAGPLPDDVRSRLDAIEGQFYAGLQNDARLASGVPEQVRPDDLDFVHMSGLTRGGPEPRDAGPEPPEFPEPVQSAAPVDAELPLSFFQPGVADVDAQMAPPSLDAAHEEDEMLTLLRGLAQPLPPRAEEPAPPAQSAPPEVDLNAILAEFTQSPYEDSVREISAGIGYPEAAPESQGPPVMPEDLFGPEPEAPARPEDLFGPDAEAPAKPEDLFGPDAEVPAKPEVLFAEEPEPARNAAGGEAADFQPPPDYLCEPFAEDEDLAFAAEPVAASVPMSVPAATPKPARPAAAPSLAEAEELLQALESQPREVLVEKPTAHALPAIPEAPPPSAAEEEEPDASVYRQPQRGVHRRKTRRQPRTAKGRVARWAFRLLAVAAVGAAAFALSYRLAPQIASPESVLAQAAQLQAAGKALEASARYSEYLVQYPGHPARAEAQFHAAFCAMNAPAAAFDEETRNSRQAYDLFRQFVADNPGHAKAARARTLMGLLAFKLRNYEEAVDVLRDPDLRLKDAEAALPALRTLARTYVQIGEWDAAESAYLQAAAMTGNYTADVDYDELGDLFKMYADKTDDPAQKTEFQQKALEYWLNAMRVPGIDPANKTKIQAKRDWLANHPDAAAPQPAESQAAAPAPETKPEIENDPPAPAAAVNPAAEADFLSGKDAAGAAAPSGKTEQPPAQPPVTQ